MSRVERLESGAEVQCRAGEASLAAAASIARMRAARDTGFARHESIPACSMLSGHLASQLP